MKIAFDIDGTLIKKDENSLDVPRYEVIDLLRAFQALGHDIYIWSGGGIQYADTWRQKLGLDTKIWVKQQTSFMDIAIDDENVELARVNIKV